MGQHAGQADGGTKAEGVGASVLRVRTTVTYLGATDAAIITVLNAAGVATDANGLLSGTRG